MAAPIGNQFWKIRSKHGRDKIFASAELLWEAAIEYFEWVDKHPWKRNEAIKSGENAGKIIKIPTQRPYTLIGLCLYIGCNEAYFRQFNHEDNKDFSTVLIRIEETIRNQKYEGGITGAFNASIVMRDLGLTEKTINEHSGPQGGAIKTVNEHRFIIEDMRDGTETQAKL